MSDQDPATAPDEQPRPAAPDRATDPLTEPKAPATSVPAWVVRDRELEEQRRARQGRRRGLWIGVVLVLLAGAWAARVLSRHAPERTAAQTVTAFFDAQRAGDCELVADLVTEASWSHDGEWTRDEFLDHCGEALVDYRPVRGPITVELSADGEKTYSRTEEDDADEAEVVFGLGDPGTPKGTLVREDGQWRVVTDLRVLAVGGSVAGRLRTFVDAYNAGDCDVLRRILAEPTWSRDGELTADEFADRCADELGPRDDEEGDQEGNQEEDDDAGAAGQLVLDQVLMGPTRDVGTEHTVDIRVHRNGDAAIEDRDDHATFALDGLTWRLVGFSAGGAGEPEVAAGASGRVVPVFDWLGLQDALVDEIVRPQEECQEYEDTSATQRGVTREFVTCFLGVLVTLQRFPDDDAAREEAEQLVESELADLPPTAADLAETSPDADPAELESYAASYRPNVEAPVPGFPAALGVRTDCSTSGCEGASVHAVRDGLLVSVEVEYGDPDMAIAAATLRAQLERLP